MAQDDAAIVHYWALNPKQFPNLEKLTMYRRKGAWGILQLSIETWLSASYGQEEGQWLRLAFHNVAQLDIDGEYLLLRTGLFIIHDIKQYQWEKLNYRVHDVEEEMLSFYCGSFEATIEQSQ